MMLCQECGKRPATFHMTRVVQNQKTERHLCEVCAREAGEFEHVLEPTLDIHQIMAGWLEHGLAAGTQRQGTDVRCPECGMEYRQFARTGMLGCHHCYETFERQLEPVLRRVHGSSRHVGKTPPVRRTEGPGMRYETRRRHEKAAKTAGQADSEEELIRLRAELERAVAEERYEDAARIRDEIRSRQSSGQSGGER